MLKRLTNRLPERAGLDGGGGEYLPFVWLTLLPTVFAAPLLNASGARVWLPTACAVVVFVPLYLVGYWARDQRQRALVTAAIGSLGVVLLPINPSAAAFIVYAGLFASLLRPLWRAMTGVAGICVLYSVEAWLTRMQPTVWFWGLLFVLVLSLTHGLVLAVQATSARLRFAEEEIAYLARQGERERIARDIHDVLGQTLSLIALKTAVAQRLLSRDVPDAEQAAGEIRQVHEISKTALAQMRGAVSGYGSTGVAAELRDAQAVLDAAGIRLDVALAAPAVSRAEDAMLGLALREAVTNVIRHASATSCSVRMAVAHDGRRTLTIADDGRGIDGKEGAGLVGMRARIASIGGVVRVVRVARSRGTHVVITLPATDDS